MKVYLAVGHGRRPNGTIDPGATLGNATEQNQGHPIVQACADRLRAAGITVRAQKAGDPNYVGYTADANTWGADLAVTVHHDWSGAPRGAFGFWHPDSTEGKRAADAIYAAIAATGHPMRRSWHQARGNLHFVNGTRMPAVLWECDRVGSVTNHAAYGRALADGILDYLGVDASPSADTGGSIVRLLRLTDPMMRGADVADWQRTIGVEDDGVFGPDTDGATRTLQTDLGVTVDGIVGPDTLAAARTPAPIVDDVQEDDMNPRQAQMLEEIHAALDDGSIGDRQNIGADLRRLRLAVRAIARVVARLARLVGVDADELEGVGEVLDEDLPLTV